ncbi:MAG: hypothetical protein E3J69_13025 [Anaerolineales bacterium]|nr:MAG: hypothetical protein E3J69_13025 [Anaerolineales bacterium]
MLKKGKNRNLLLILVVVIAVFTVFGISLAFGAPWGSDPTPFPTDYPGPKQTIVVAEALTREAALLTPLPTGGSKLSVRPTPMPLEIFGPPGTPVGAGMITEHSGLASAFIMGLFEHTGLPWYEIVGREVILVFPGVSAQDPNQGVVIVTRSGGSRGVDESWHETPIKAGAIWIVDAVSERLILNSDGGETFYFDVPGDRFVNSLSDVVPTITPRPIIPTATLMLELVSDDAPNEPGIVLNKSPLNADLLYYIDPSGDEDWFLFHTDTIGNIEVSLTNLPASYGFSVLRVSDRQWVGKVDEDGVEDKMLELADAPPDDYLVRVFGIDGVWNAELPYTLRFGPVLSSFVVLGEEGVYLKQNAVVESGDVGVNTTSDGPFLAGQEELTIGIGVTFSDPNSRVMGDSIKIKQNAQVYDVYYNELSGLGEVLGDHFTPIELPLTTSLPSIPTINPGEENIEVPSGETLVLHGGNYGALEARQGATVIFAGGLYHFEEWDIGLSVNMYARSPMQVRIEGKLQVDQGSYLGPSIDVLDLNATDIVIYVNGINGSNGNLGATPKAAKFGIDSTVIANVYVPNGTLWIRQGATARGAFIGKWVIVGLGTSVSMEGYWR